MDKLTQTDARNVITRRVVQKWDNVYALTGLSREDTPYSIADMESAADEAVRQIQTALADQLDALAVALHAAQRGGTAGSPAKVRKAVQDLLAVTDATLGVYRS